VWAEDSTTNQWWCVVAKKLQGDAAFLLVQEIEKYIVGMNIYERICDCNPAGFYKEAHRQGIRYIPVQDKVGRKAITIDKLNEELTKQGIMLSEHAGDMAQEFLTAKWADGGSDKIKRSSSWHLIDTARYFVDKKPTPLAIPRAFTSELNAVKQLHREQLAEREKKTEQQRQMVVTRQNKFRARQNNRRIV
jgi:hypothetical protein